MAEIIFAALSQEENEEVREVAGRIRAYGTLEDGVADENVIKQAKLYVTIKKWMKENDCQAGSLQCWDAVQKNYGCATCLTMSMLGEEGIPMSCEGDVMGAVTMYAMYLASLSPSGYLTGTTALERTKHVYRNPLL